MAHLRLGLALLACAACSDTTAPSPSARAPNNAASASDPTSARRFPEDDASWGRFHSKRFNLSFPLPDGKSWRIDDHSRPWLFAVHDATSSKVWVLAEQEDDLVNRQKCEERARTLGWMDSKTLTTVEEQVTIGPEAYDSRIWVALDAAKPGGKLVGHLFLFGAFVRRCLLIHVETAVPGRASEDVLSDRLALARARIVQGLTLDPPRTTEDATVPRDKADIRR